MAPRAAQHRPRRRAGFTLFEVMAAVIVLGMLYSVLATSAIQGLRSEGQSRRRLEASLIVDELLLELEAELAGGETPPIGTSESEMEPYVVVMDVRPFDLASYLGEIGGIGGEEDATLPLEQIESPLLVPPDQPEESVLRIVDLAVRWREAEGEHEVRRTTFVYDAAAVAGLFPETEGEGEGEVPDIDPDEITNPDGSPNIQKMQQIIDALGGRP